jgi:hypothetical protein
MEQEWAPPGEADRGALRLDFDPPPDGSVSPVWDSSDSG